LSFQQHNLYRETLPIADVLSQARKEEIMRSSFFILVLAAFLFTLMSISYVYAGDSSYKSPWVETDMNLAKLIKKGYRIVGTTVDFGGARDPKVNMEVIYLQKKEKLYRCTSRYINKGIKHECKSLVEPKKTK